MRTFTAVLYREEDIRRGVPGGRHRQPGSDGRRSDGRDVRSLSTEGARAVANLKEATEFYLEEAPPLRREARAPVTGCTDFPLEDGRRPIITTFEVAEGARA